MDIEASGAPTWKTLNEGSPLIQFNVDCTNLSGDFSIQYGVLDINANLCTTGDILFGGATTAVSRIKLEAGHKATFNGSCN